MTIEVKIMEKKINGLLNTIFIISFIILGSIQGQIVSAKDDIVIDFGGIGLWARMNNSVWLHLSNNSPDGVITGDVDGNGMDDVVADFKSTIGGIFIKRNGGGWSQLSKLSSQSMASGDLDGNGQDDIVIDFGSSGLYARMNDASWLKLNNASPDQVVLTDMDGNGQDDVIADFGSTVGGLYTKLNGGIWTKLINNSPYSMTTGDLDGIGGGELVVYILQGQVGDIWVLFNNSRWWRVSFFHSTIGTPVIVVTGDVDGNGQDDMVLNVGPGYGYVHLSPNLTGGYRLTDNTADQIVMGDMDGNGQSEVIGAFNSSIGGIYAYHFNNDIWIKTHNNNPEDMAVGDLDGI